jgi:hypothetical protein
MKIQNEIWHDKLSSKLLYILALLCATQNLTRLFGESHRTRIQKEAPM